jgi:hypothetical protein
MNNINNCLPNFNQEDNAVLCSDAHGNMSVGELEYSEIHECWVCVKCVGFEHRIVLFGVRYWKFTSEIFSSLAASGPSRNVFS